MSYFLDFSGSKCFRAHAPGHASASTFEPSVPSGVMTHQMLAGFGAITLCIQGAGGKGRQGFQCRQSADFDQTQHRLLVDLVVLFGQAHQMKQALHKVGLNYRGLPMQVCRSSERGPTSVLPLVKGRDTARGVGICVGPKD